MVHVLSVVERFPSVAQIPGINNSCSGCGGNNKGCAARRHGRTASDSRPARRWSTEILVGNPATVIAEVAKEREADLIVIGAGRHGMVDRLIGEETASNLAKVLQRPFLIASPTLARLPERAVIALDLDRADRTALLRTLELLGTPENVSVLHVKPRSESSWNRLG